LSLRRLEPLALALTGVAFGAAIALVAYRTSPVVPLVGAATLAALAIAAIRPVAAVCLAVALVPLELFVLPVGQFGLNPAEALFALTGVTWGIAQLAGGKAAWVPSPLGKPLAVLILALVPGLLVTREPELIVKVLAFWFCFFLLYQMIVSDGRVETVRWILFVLALSGGVVGVIATVRSGAGETQELVGFGEIVTGRALGSFGHPNVLATFEGLALPAALAIGLSGRPGWRVPALLAFGAALSGLALSLSRGGLLAAAGALLMMLAWPPFRRAAAVAALVVAAFAVTGATPFGDIQQVETLTARLSSVTYSAGGVDQRFQVWDATPEMIEDHQLIGVGEGGYPDAAPQYGLVNLNSSGTFEHAHNIPLTIAAELGLLGLAALLWLTGALVLVLWRAYRRSHYAERALVVAIAAAFAALALQGMVDYTLRSNAIVAAVFVLAGCAVVLYRHALASSPAAAR
jgi:putative inorganic carbon (HCO3(-)) transporter